MNRRAAPGEMRHRYMVTDADGAPVDFPRHCPRVAQPGQRVWKRRGVDWQLVWPRTITETEYLTAL